MQKFFAQLFTYRLEKHVIVPPPVDRIDWTQGVPETRWLGFVQIIGEEEWIPNVVEQEH